MTEADESMFKSVVSKVARYCAYQERSPKEVEEKLRSFNLSFPRIQEAMNFLREENFFSEERFCEAYARGKFRLKKWGKIKISIGLKSHSLDEHQIQKALEAIPQNDYLETAKSLVSKKHEALIDLDPNKRLQRLKQYMLSKGYEYDIINQIIKS